MGASIYYITFLFFAFLIILTKKHTKLQFLPFLLLVLFSGLRYNVGADFLNYTDINKQLVNGNYPWGIETGYKYLVLAINKIGGQQQLVFFIMSLLTVFFTYKFIKKESPDFVMSSLLYVLIGPFYLSSMNGVRQALAISMFSYALTFLKSDRYLKYTLIVLLAGLFHTSAFILYPIALLIQKRYKITTIIVFFIILILIAQSNLIVLMMQFLSYENLITYGSYSVDLSLVVFLIIGLSMIILIEKFGIPQQMNIYYNMGIISLLLVTLTLLTDKVSSVAFMRFNNYFFYAYLILIPIISKKFKEKLLVKNIIYFFAIIYFTIVIFTGVNMLPYYFNINLF